MMLGMLIFPFSARRPQADPAQGNLSAPADPAMPSGHTTAEEEKDEAAGPGLEAEHEARSDASTPVSQGTGSGITDGPAGVSPGLTGGSARPPSREPRWAARRS
jgi:hypothetical protein